MKVKEAAKVLGLKVRTIRQWIDEGKIDAVKVGSCWNIPEEIIYSTEVQERANKGRERARRIKEGIELGMLAGRGKNPEESI